MVAGLPGSMVGFLRGVLTETNHIGSTCIAQDVVHLLQREFEILIRINTQISSLAKRDLSLSVE